MVKEVKEVKGQEKMSYEELNNIAHQLSEQANTLYVKLQEANMTNAFKRLDYLFKVLELVNCFPQEFAIKCSEEIIMIMTIPEKEQIDTGSETMPDTTSDKV